MCKNLRQYLLYKFNKMDKSFWHNNYISDENEKLSYYDFFQSAYEISKKLEKHKYGILCNSQLKSALSLLACIIAGKTAVILSSNYGENHVKNICDTTLLSYIINDHNIIKIAEEKREPEMLNDIPLILCTSGTTGKAKGIMLTNENITTNLTDINDYFHINEKDKILIARPLYHCAVLVGEFLYGLSVGANIHFYNGLFNPNEIDNIIHSEKITVMGGTPTLFYYLCKNKIRQKQQLSIRAAVISGECLNDSTIDIIKKATENVDLYHVYGLTEASPRVAYLSPDEFLIRSGSVGKTLKSVEAKIKNGELLIKGKSIMKGYYNNPEATKKAFDDGWLKTGDAANIDENGYIYIKGRTDDMIIRAGVNIYPQEIENILKQDPDIHEIIVYGTKENVSQSINLKVITNKTKNQIFSLCKKLLPAYQLPDNIEIVDSLPRNASGKLIRKNLKKSE